MFRFVSFFPILSVSVFLKWVGVGILCSGFAMHIPFSVNVASPQWLFSLHFVALLSSDSIRLPASSTRTSTHPHPQSFGPHCLFWHTFHFSAGCAGLWEVGGVGGDCGLETNLCSFTMNQKKPHFFQRFGFSLNSSALLHIFGYNHFLAKTKTDSWKILLF